MEPRRGGKRRAVLAVTLGFAVSFAFLAAVGGPKMRGRPLGFVVALVALWLPIAVGATWAGVGRGRSMLGRRALWGIAVTTVTPVVLLASWVGVALVWPETLVDASGMSEHLTCIGLTIAFAAGPLVAFSMLRRRSDPVHPRLTGAAIATAAGAWGAVILSLVCGFTSPRHILLGHLLPVVLICALGAVLGKRLVEVRAKVKLPGSR
ncbi:MAG: NrsF family protein [Polyangiaceae bacterium]